MGFKDFITKKKEQVGERVQNFNERRTEEREFSREMKGLEASERRSSYQSERKRLAIERGRSAGREQARRPTIRDKVVSSFMENEKRGGGVFQENFIDVNAPNPRTSESVLSSGFEGAMFGGSKKSERMPIHDAFFGGGGKGMSLNIGGFGEERKTRRKHHAKAKHSSHSKRGKSITINFR